MTKEEQRRVAARRKRLKAKAGKGAVVGLLVLSASLSVYAYFVF